MNTKIRRQLAARKRRIERRLDKPKLRGMRAADAAGQQHPLRDWPTGRAAWPTAASAPCVLLVRELGLTEAIDRRLAPAQDPSALPRVRSRAQPRLQRAVRRHLPGRPRTAPHTTKSSSTPWARAAFPTRPRPATSAAAFKPHDVHTLLDVYQRRRGRRSGPGSRRRSSREARIDMDGTLVRDHRRVQSRAWTSPTTAPGAIIRWSCRWPTPAKCCQHRQPLRQSSLARRGGRRGRSRPCASACEGGFRQVLLRGDTDFTQTKHLDRWNDDPRVRFIFGIDCTAELARSGRRFAGRRPGRPLTRPPRYPVKTRAATRPDERQGADRPRARVQEHPPGKARRWPSSPIGRRPASKTLSPDRGPQEPDGARRARVGCSTTTATSST